MALGLGSSLGDRRQHLELALRRLDAHRDVEIVRISGLVRTPPLSGGAARNWFLNGVATIETHLEPEAFLQRCVALEASAGRRRGLRWADRPLDLDLLLFGEAVIDTPTLIVPHPAIATRRFVLEPLLEIWPDAQDPVSGLRYADHPPAPGPRPVPVGPLALRRRLRYL